jgi:hypothetical protein
VSCEGVADSFKSQTLRLGFGRNVERALALGRIVLKDEGKPKPP